MQIEVGIPVLLSEKMQTLESCYSAAFRRKKTTKQALEKLIFQNEITF